MFKSQPSYYSIDDCIPTPILIVNILIIVMMNLLYENYAPFFPSFLELPPPALVVSESPNGRQVLHELEKIHAHDRHCTAMSVELGICILFALCVQTSDQRHS